MLLIQQQSKNVIACLPLVPRRSRRAASEPGDGHCRSCGPLAQGVGRAAQVVEATDLQGGRRGEPFNLGTRGSRALERSARESSRNRK
eukprot:13769943-Alexandrium_andersonii.AAC.1